MILLVFVTVILSFVVSILFSIICFLLGSYKDLLEDRLELMEIPRKKIYIANLPISVSETVVEVPQALATAS